MKRILIFLITLMMVMTSCAWAEVSETDAPRILVAYFSRAGENYNVGVTDPSSASASYAGYIEKGNTAIVAEIIAELTGGDLFEITTVREYPADYATMLTVAQEEYNDNARPELSSIVENMDDYDVVFLGYPIWWGGFPMAIHTFMESYDFTGKTVIPFNTHEGSGTAGTIAVICDALPDAEVLDGLPIQGKVAQEQPERAKELVEAFLEKVGLPE